ncbi:MAG: PspC domain-containing protein, partial [archaeon]|nr:PspC domain-containing protein [archaeon]
MAGYTKNKLILTGFSPGIVFLITIFLLTLVCVPDAGSVSIKTIQRGRVSIGAQDRAGIASIETVNVATSMLIVSNFATKNTADDEMAALCTAEFSSDSQIYITRNEGQGNSTNAEYMVVEFNEKVNVQGGYTKIAYNSPGRGVYLGSSVETNHAFILATTLSPVVHGTKSDMFCTYEFGANNRIDFLRNARNNQDVIEFAWYVVEFEEDVNVYHGETPLAAGTSSIPDVAIGGTVNPDKSFVIVSCRAADAASTYADIKTAAEVNTGGTTLTLSRKGSSTGAVCCWSVVEFTDGTTVQKNKIVDNAADTSDGINTSDGERAFAFINNNTATTGNQCREWQVAANVGGLSDTYSNPATTINFDRGGTALMDIVWHVVECPPVSIVAPNSNELWRVGTPYNIEWTHSDSVLSDGTGYGGSHKIRIDLSLDFGVDGYPYTIYETPASPEVSDYDCSSDSFPWTIPPTIDATDIISNNCRIKITDVDEETSGNSQSVFDISDAPFEIIADIESRIAEILQERMSDTKQVVNITDVDHVTEMMGQPSDFAEEDEPVHEDKKSKERTYYSRTTKRLYRDPENKMIGGVCGGLGAYFNTDPLWFRLLFVALIIFSGVGLLIYIVLWVVVPEAYTTAEKLEMRGEPVNV